MAHTSLLVLALFVVGCQSWKLPAIPAGRRAQFYTQQSDGAYKFGYDSAEGLFQVQEADPANEVRGKFGADGGHLEYTAGVDGFVVRGHEKARASQVRQYSPAHTNAPAVRFATLEELITPPRPVEDTPEVADAKRRFKATFEAAAAAAEAAPDVNIITGSRPVQTTSFSYQAPVNTYRVRVSQPGFTQAHTSPTVRFATLQELNTLPKPVQDTPEVAQAKQVFKAAYDEAAAVAEAAPDTGIITGSAPTVTTTYSYSAPQIRTSYIAPAAPAVFVAPGPVEDTAEVKAAKQAFKTAYDAAAAATDAAPDVNIITGPAPAVSTTHSYSVPQVQTSYIARGPVEDTFEVKAAKQAFRAAYDAAAAAADAAPDTDIITAPAGSFVRASSSRHHGGDSTITYTVDGGVMVMQADGFSAPTKFGYTYE